MTVASSPIARRLRAALFQLRAIVVFVALTIGIVAWMLLGVVGAALTSLLRPLFWRKRRPSHTERSSRSSFYPPDSSSPTGRLGVLPTWLRA